MLSLVTAPEAGFSIAEIIAPAIQPDTTIQIPWGLMITDAADYVSTLLLAAIMFAFRFLPARLYSLLMTMQVEQLLQRAIPFGINSVAGAARDKVLTIDVSNSVLREALTYAILHGGALVKRFAGSPVDLAEKIWARLPVDEAAAKPDFATIAAQVAMTLPAKDDA